MTLGYLICGLLALLCVLATERGRLFREDALAVEPAPV